MRNSLQAKQKLGFIDGTLTKPTQEPYLSLWLAANSMIIGWIRTSMDSKIHSTFSYESVAATLWEFFELGFQLVMESENKCWKMRSHRADETTSQCWSIMDAWQSCGKNCITTTQLRHVHVQPQQTYYRNERMIEFTSSYSVSIFLGSATYSLRSPVKIRCVLWIRFTHG